MSQILILLFLLPVSGFSSVNLNDSYKEALKTNQVNALNNARVLQSAEAIKGYQGAYYPKVFFKGTYQKYENLADSKSYGLGLSQTLYKGGRDQLAVESSKETKTSSENQWEYEKLVLYQNVIQAYYNYFLSLNDLKNLELLKKQSLERVNEIKNRVKIGRSRNGELLQAEAQLASVDAQLLGGLALKQESEDKFYLLTGVDKNQTINEVLPEFKVTKPLEYFLEVAKQRPDINNKKLKINVSELELESSKRAHFPTLDLTSNYYLNKRAGTYQNSNWDAGLVLTFPLFEGGATSAKTRETIQKKEEAIYSHQDSLKTLELEITSKFQVYNRFVLQIPAYDLALTKAKTNYEESLKDYRLGLVSTLDVLSALNLYLDSKRNSEKTKISAMMNLKVLEASAGVIE